MAASMQTLFGDVIDVRWVSGNVKVSVNGGAETTAFALATESGLAILPVGNRWLIVYQDGTGAVQRKYSTNRGTTWT